MLSAFLRGGNWDNGANAGAFALNLNNAPSNTNTNIGFRCSSLCGCFRQKDFRRFQKGVSGECAGIRHVGEEIQEGASSGVQVTTSGWPFLVCTAAFAVEAEN